MVFQNRVTINYSLHNKKSKTVARKFDDKKIRWLRRRLYIKKQSHSNDCSIRIVLLKNLYKNFAFPCGYMCTIVLIFYPFLRTYIYCTVNCVCISAPLCCQNFVLPINSNFRVGFLYTIQIYCTSFQYCSLNKLVNFL